MFWYFSLLGLLYRSWTYQGTLLLHKPLCQRRPAAEGQVWIVQDGISWICTNQKIIDKFAGQKEMRAKFMFKQWYWPVFLFLDFDLIWLYLFGITGHLKVKSIFLWVLKIYSPIFRCLILNGLKIALCGMVIWWWWCLHFNTVDNKPTLHRLMVPYACFNSFALSVFAELSSGASVCLPWWIESPHTFLAPTTTGNGVTVFLRVLTDVTISVLFTTMANNHWQIDWTETKVNWKKSKMR